MRIRLTRIAALAGFLSSAAFGYYHFVHYANGIGPFQAIQEKFDLTALPNNTVTYQISDAGPTNYSATDGFPFVVSQIRAAAKVWNDVETSDLRLRFGGVAPLGSSQGAATPSIDIVFEDLPPGVNGYGGPTVRRDIVSNGSGTLVPIQRSVVVLSKDIASRPTWSEQYFLTAVHELGHALGLQHSFVSGAMATEITRATTKIRPILPDDVIGLSLLYPSKSFREGLGSITGRVAVSGSDEGIGLASVVAITPGGAAVSTLTHPDGTYRIDGLLPGQYFIYAHPLPPAMQGEATPGNVVLPVDANNRTLAGGQQFDTVFFPASRTPFTTVEVTANEVRDGIDFPVTRRTTPTSIHSITTYSYPGQRAVKPAHIYLAGGRNLVVMAGQGIVQNSQPAPGLQISTISGTVTVPAGGIRPYSPLPEYYLQSDFQFGQFAAEGPVHLLFTRNNDVYVLPYALRIVERTAPQIDSVIRTDDGDAIVSGSGFNGSTRVEFDGAFATVKSYDEIGGRLVVTPPAAAPGTTLHATAFGSDGQSSLFLQTPVTVQIPGGSGDFAPAGTGIGLSTSSVPAGTESLIEVSGTNFAEGATSVGFGTPDIDVRKVWFPSPNRMYVNVRVAPNAALASYNMTVLNGVRLTTLNGALQVNGSKAPWFDMPGNLVAGSNATIHVNGLSFGQSAAIQVSLNDRPMQVMGVDGSNVTIALPTDLPAGVAVLRLIAGADSALPLAVTIARPQATVASVTVGFGNAVTADRPAHYGELTNVQIVGLPENLAPTGSQPKVTLTIGGLEHRLLTVNPGGSVMQLQFTLQSLVPQGTQTLHITVEGVAVTPYALPVRAF
ncbi:MAG TPA: matrixin family metalloprotease [Bryobacteraceae bacterium]|nr:matrixin family metalloprotease [Bryobacteraceae bacterium]